MAKKTFVKKVAEEPAILLDESITAAQNINKNIQNAPALKKGRTTGTAWGQDLLPEHQTTTHQA